jgi:cell fate regulator YaaT (PSP1 superfamily)
LFIFNDIIVSLFSRCKHKDGLQEKSDKDLRQLKTVISNLQSDIVEHKQTNDTLSNRLEILREEKLELEERMRLINMNFTFNKYKYFFYGRHHDLVDRYGTSVSHLTMDMFHLSFNHFPVLSSFMTYHWVCN